MLELSLMMFISFMGKLGEILAQSYLKYLYLDAKLELYPKCRIKIF